MANKAFTKSREWYRAHMLNWLLYCTKGYRQIVRRYSGDRKLSNDIRSLAQQVESDLGRIEARIELKIHEHARKAMGGK